MYPVPLWIWTKRSKQRTKRRTITHNVPISFMSGNISDNRGPLMGTRCVSVSCSDPQALWLTAVLSLIRSMLPFPAMQHPVQHIRTQLHLKEAQQPPYIHMSIIPPRGLPSKCQWSWNQRQEKKNTKGQCQNENFALRRLCVLLKVWDELCELLWVTHFSQWRLLLTLLIRPIGEMVEFAYVATARCHSKVGSTLIPWCQFAKFYPVTAQMSNLRQQTVLGKTTRFIGMCNQQTVSEKTSLDTIRNYNRISIIDHDVLI